MKESEKRLLAEDDNSEGSLDNHTPREERSSMKTLLLVFVLLQIILIISYTSIFMVLNVRHLKDSGFSHDLNLSPAKDAIRFEQRYFEKQGHATSLFSGPPRPALEEAWHNLLSGMNIRVSGEYLTPFSAKSIPLAGGGLAAQLGMYHELHCLKKIRHWIYKEHYHAGLTVEELARQENHIQHCLEWLRVAALCRGDTVLTTFAWDGDKLETEYPIPRQCVDSEHLLAWSQNNAVNLSSPGIFEAR